MAVPGARSLELGAGSSEQGAREHGGKSQAQAKDGTISLAILSSCGISLSKIDFANFLNTSRRSTFEVANVLLLLGNNGYLEGADLAGLLGRLEEESRMLLAFVRTLRDSDAAN